MCEISTEFFWNCILLIQALAFVYLLSFIIDYKPCITAANIRALHRFWLFECFAYKSSIETELPFITSEVQTLLLFKYIFQSSLFLYTMHFFCLNMSLYLKIICLYCEDIFFDLNLCVSSLWQDIIWPVLSFLLHINDQTGYQIFSYKRTADGVCYITCAGLQSTCKWYVEMQLYACDLTKPGNVL